MTTKEQIADVSTDLQGTIFAFHVNTPAGREWFAENVETESWQWLGNTLGVEPRYAERIVQGLQDAGLTVD